jgi:hypothetical protein
MASAHVDEYEQILQGDSFIQEGMVFASPSCMAQFDIERPNGGNRMGVFARPLLRVRLA